MNKDRRQILKLSCGAAVGLSLLPASSWAGIPEMEQAIYDMFGDQTISEGRVKLSIPTLSENGYSVDLKVEADSPMTGEDYVRRIAIFSNRNPIPLVAVYHFTPLSGQAKVGSKIRLGGSQIVHAIAEMSDGSLWRSSAKVFVTLAACVTG